MAEEVVVMSLWPTSKGLRPKIALEEKQVRYREEAKNEEFGRKLKTSGRDFPSLVHNGKSIEHWFTQVQYIDEMWPQEPRLLPADPYFRAESRRVARFVQRKMINPIKWIFLEKTKGQEAAKKDLLETLRTLELQLGDKQYLVGDQFGFADIALIVYYSCFPVYEKYGNLSIEAEAPKLVSWAKRCLERQSVARSLPDQATVLQYCEQYGAK